MRLKDPLAGIKMANSHIINHFSFFTVQLWLVVKYTDEELEGTKIHSEAA